MVTWPLANSLAQRWRLPSSQFAYWNQEVAIMKFLLVQTYFFISLIVTCGHSFFIYIYNFFFVVFPFSWLISPRSLPDLLSAWHPNSSHSISEYHYASSFTFHRISAFMFIGWNFAAIIMPDYWLLKLDCRWWICLQVSLFQP